jgi:uncharacterized protein YprB with RNaseH-like and TPR domain
LRVTFWDIEAAVLSANFGRLLCCSFIDLDSDEVQTFRHDQRKYRGVNAIDDSKLAIAIRDRLEAADICVGWNSILYDAPFVNARLALAGQRPIRLTKDNGTMHIDPMYYANGGASLRIGSKKLDTVSKFFQLEEQKTPLTGPIWALASAGDKEAMNQVVEHCEADVRVLKAVWPHVAGYIKKVTFTLSEVWPFLAEIPSRRNAA